MTWREELAAAQARLDEAGVPDPEVDAWLLMSESCAVTRAWYFLHCEEETGEAFAGEAFHRAVDKRCARIPLQQLTGHQQFMGLDFIVSRDVLIPRQDSETLALSVIEELKARCGQYPGQGRVRVLDLCTGSGCIGISIERLLAAELPDIEVIGTDISAAALGIADINARRAGCRHFATLLGDLFESVDGRFDVIVSNPPYIRSGEIAGLEEEVRLHEPLIALDGGEDGLSFYRRIADEGPAHLVPGGRLYLEVGSDEAQDVREIFSAAGFEDIRVIPDLSGRDRVLAAVMRGDGQGE